MNKDTLDRQIASPYRYKDAATVQQRVHSIVGTGSVPIGFPFPSQLPKITERLRIVGFKAPWFGNHGDWAKRIIFTEEAAWVSLYPHVHLTVAGWGDRFWNGAGMWCMKRDATNIKDWPAAAWLEIVLDRRVLLLMDVLEKPPHEEEIVFADA